MPCGWLERRIAKWEFVISAHIPSATPLVRGAPWPRGVDAASEPLWPGVRAHPDHRRVRSGLCSWCAQTQRDEAAALKNARQHREEFANEAKRQTGGGRGSDLTPAKPMTPSGSKELPDDDCCLLRQGDGGPFPLPLPEITPIRSDCAVPRYLRQRLGRKWVQQRLFQESVIALNSLSNSACRVLRDEPGSVSSSSASPLPPTGSQSSVLLRVRAKVISAGPPPVGLSEQEALTELLHCQDFCALQPSAPRGLRPRQVAGQTGRCLAERRS